MTKSKKSFKDRLKDASDTIAAVTVIGAAAVVRHLGRDPDCCRDKRPH